MNQLLHKLISILFFCIVTLVCTCKRKDNPPDDINVPNVYNYSQEQAEQIARNFAVSYQPDSLPYDGVGKLENVPDSVVFAFKALHLTKSTIQNKWLAVIFLKLSLDHLRCCHQGYEVRNSRYGGVDSLGDPLLYEYLLWTKFFDVNSKRIEFINSRVIADTWVDQDTSFTSDPDIQVLFAAMKPIEDSIQKDLYW